jgi:hypothetical protein
MAKSFAKSGVVRISYSRRAASSAFTNLRTGERCDNENALLAAILADATNFGLGRRAAASHGVTRDKLVWTAGACVRPETYKAALARIIDAHHVLPIATIWADGRAFLRISVLLLRQARRRCGRDQRALRTWSRLRLPYPRLGPARPAQRARYVGHKGAIRARWADAPRHGFADGTHYTDTGCASDHGLILCTLLGFRNAHPRATTR